MNHLEGKIQIYKRRNGKFNLYLDYAAWQTETEKKRRANKRTFVNWFRKQYPTHLNEFREMPSFYYGIGCHARVRKVFVAYDLTKTEIMMAKLAWVWNEEKVTLLRLRHECNRSNYDYYYNCVATEFITPTKKCQERFRRPDFKQKLLKE